MAQKRTDELALTDMETFSIIIVSSLILFLIYSMWLNPQEPIIGPEIYIIKVEDGNNINDTHGCFFLLLSGSGVDIDPKEHSFFVAEGGLSFSQLDFGFRYYNEDEDQTPYGGDRNASGCPICENFDENNWQEGEYIGFDMPTRDMGIDIVDGNIYDVMIKDPGGNVIYRDSFVYTCQRNASL